MLHPSDDPSPEVSAWEAAYQRFETPEEEIAKFTKRLRRLGVPSWQKDLRVLELMCGRGNGIKAWHQLGFTEVEGIDLSPQLVAAYDGPAKVHVGDVRELPFPDSSKDVLCVQGGLHHLKLMDDLRLALKEARRVLVTRGRLVVVEPWLTPFLRFVHATYSFRVFRAAWPKLDALATMNELEGDTYDGWLAASSEILDEIQSVFAIERCERRWGKLMLIAARV